MASVAVLGVVVIGALEGCSSDTAGPDLTTPTAPTHTLSTQQRAALTCAQDAQSVSDYMLALTRKGDQVNSQFAYEGALRAWGINSARFQALAATLPLSEDIIQGRKPQSAILDTALSTCTRLLQ